MLNVLVENDSEGSHNPCFIRINFAIKKGEYYCECVKPSQSLFY